MTSVMVGLNSGCEFRLSQTRSSAQRGSFHLQKLQFVWVKNNSINYTGWTKESHSNLVGPPTKQIPVLSRTIWSLLPSWTMPALCIITYSDTFLLLVLWKHLVRVKLTYFNQSHRRSIIIIIKFRSTRIALKSLKQIICSLALCLCSDLVSNHTHSKTLSSSYFELHITLLPL